MKKITKSIQSQILFTYLLFIMFSLTTFAQVGIGTTTPAGGALLDLTATDKALLVPRVNITNLNTIAPVTGGGATRGLLVWNTRAATGEGFHYWSGSQWIPLVGGTPSNDWALAGNTITGTEVLGTSSNHDLNIITNNIENMRVQANGEVTVGFGAAAANTGDQFSAAGVSAVNGYTGNGLGVYGQALSGGIAVYGFADDAYGVVGDADSGDGVYGLSLSGIGVRGESDSGIATLGISNSSVGVQGQSTSSRGVVGIGSTFGTIGFVNGGVGAQGQATSGIGVVGITTTTGTGVYGIASNNAALAGNFFNSGADSDGIHVGGANTGPYGVTGSNVGISGAALDIGVVGFADEALGTGIIGVGNNLPTFSVNPNGSGVAGTGNEIGVYGVAVGTTGEGVTGTGFTGVAGYGDLTTGIGIYGQGDAGIFGIGNFGVYGAATTAAGWGVYSNGDLGTTGDTYATGTKFFGIDHPLDPANKYLRHASIESNEVLNLYRGKEVFDANGKATVSLPDYYDAVNKNASYQLTPIGAAMPNLYIEKEVENGTFIIAGGVSGKKVSWQLTAERNDPYMQQNPENRNMEVDKGENRGKYLTPELYGKSEELSITYREPKKGSITDHTNNQNRAVTLQKVKLENKTETIKPENIEAQEISPNKIKRGESKNTDVTTKAIKLNSVNE